MPQAHVQELFNAATYLVYHVFPEQINGRPMHDDWKECNKYIQQGLALAISYRDYKSEPISLKPSLHLGELLKSCAWYAIKLFYFII